MNRSELLTAAQDAVAHRPRSYGSPERNFTRISRHWNVYLTGKYGAGSAPLLDAVDVAAMMALMKIARLEETPDHVDSWVDLAGYAACGAECATVIEHDPDEVALDYWYDDDPSPPAPRFKVGDLVRVVEGSRIVYEVRVVDPASVDNRYGIQAAGSPWHQSAPRMWSDDELEPATPRFKVGDPVTVSDMSGQFFVHRISSVGTYSIADQYGSIFHDYPEGELTPA